MTSTQTSGILHPSAEEDLASDKDLVLADAVVPIGKVTITDVARAAGVSTTAVSYALNGKGRLPEATRQIVLEAAKQLGYEANYFAQRIKGGCSKTVAFFSSDISGVSGEKVGRIQEDLVRMGFFAPLHGLGHASPEAHTEAIRQMRLQRPRAIVCSSPLHEDALNELRRFRDEEGIVVCYDTIFAPDFEQVNLDRETGAYRAVRHLIERGHRDIGISTHQWEPLENVYVQGMRRALKEAGLQFENKWYLPAYPFELAGKSVFSKFMAMRNRPTAFYIVDERAAAAFVNYALRGGLQVPRDISIVTHDQVGISEHSIVPLTVVSHPSFEITSSVASMLLSRLEEGYDGPPRHAVISGQLIERESVHTMNDTG